jgi:hypothetical protein
VRKPTGPDPAKRPKGPSLSSIQAAAIRSQEDHARSLTQLHSKVDQQMGLFRELSHCVSKSLGVQAAILELVGQMRMELLQLQGAGSMQAVGVGAWAGMQGQGQGRAWRGRAGSGWGTSAWPGALLNPPGPPMYGTAPFMEVMSAMQLAKEARAMASPLTPPQGKNASQGKSKGKGAPSQPEPKPKPKPQQAKPAKPKPQPKAAPSAQPAQEATATPSRAAVRRAKQAEQQARKARQQALEEAQHAAAAAHAAGLTPAQAIAGLAAGKAPAAKPAKAVPPSDRQLRSQTKQAQAQAGDAAGGADRA